MSEEAPGAAPRFERRAPTIASYELALQPRRLREELLALEDATARLEPAERRLVRVLVSHIAAHWIGRHGPSHCALAVRVALSESFLRLDLRVEPGLADPDAWESLFTPHVVDFVSRWGEDRRRPPGAWFEIPRPAFA